MVNPRINYSYQSLLCKTISAYILFCKYKDMAIECSNYSIVFNSPVNWEFTIPSLDCYFSYLCFAALVSFFDSSPGVFAYYEFRREVYFHGYS